MEELIKLNGRYYQVCTIDTERENRLSDLILRCEEAQKWLKELIEK